MAQEIEKRYNQKNNTNLKISDYKKEIGGRLITYMKDSLGFSDKEIKEILQKYGYDGIDALEYKDGKYKGQYVVFKSNQAKNVDNLNPTSDPDTLKENAEKFEQLSIQGFNENSGGQLTLDAWKKYQTNKNEANIILKDSGTEIKIQKRKMARDFINKGYIDINGKKVTSAIDVVDIAQIFRNPQYETFRMIYTKNDTIVGQEAISSRIVGQTSVFTSEDMKDNRGFYKIKDRMSRLGADGYYMIHNHPSGNAKMSDADLDVTANFYNKIDGFKGHIVVNSGTYAMITSDGKVLDNQKITNYSPDEIDKMMSSDPFYNIKINRETLTNMAFDLKNNPNYATIIMADQSLKARIVLDIPNNFFNMKDEQIRGYIRNIATKNGAERCFIATQDNNVFKKATSLGILQDGILYNTSENGNVTAKSYMQVNGNVKISSLFNLPSKRVTEAQEKYTPIQGEQNIEENKEMEYNKTEEGVYNGQERERNVGLYGNVGKLRRNNSTTEIKDSGKGSFNLSDAFEDFIFEAEWEEQQKKWAEEKKQNENKAPVKKDIAPKKQTNREQTETVENRDILDTTKTFKDGRDKQYYKYKRQTKAYDNSSLQNAMNLVNPNYQGRRDVNQWLQVAKQIGTEIADKSDAEIEQIAYRSWFEAKPNSKENLNRHGKKYVAFNSDIWLNTIYDQVKDVRENQTKAPAKQAPVKQEAKVEQNASNTKQEAKLPVKENTPGEPNGKTRQSYITIENSEKTLKEQKRIAHKLAGTDKYIETSNKEQLARADNVINASDYDTQLSSLEAKARTGEAAKPTDIAVLERLMQHYLANGDVQNLERVIRTRGLFGTGTAQALQMFSMVKRLSPAGQALWVQQTVERTNNEIAKKHKATIQTDENGNTRVVTNNGKDITDKVKLFQTTPEMLEDITNSKDSEELAKNVDKAYKELGQQIPKSTMEKLDEWRYFAMLANPKTHIRNIVGNKAMGATQDIKNKLAGGIEDVVSKFNPEMERTRTAKRASKETRNFAKADLESSEVQSMLEIGTDKYTEATNPIKENQRTFENSFLENTLGRAFRADNKALEVEDAWGLKSAYAKSLANYITANNYDINNMTSEQLQKARNFAVEEAK